MSLIALETNYIDQKFEEFELKIKDHLDTKIQKHLSTAENVKLNKRQVARALKICPVSLYKAISDGLIQVESDGTITLAQVEANRERILQRFNKL